MREFRFLKELFLRDRVAVQETFTVRKTSNGIGVEDMASSLT